MSKARYTVRPKADQDLADQALYYATHAAPEIGHRFLVAAHDTLTVLTTQPLMGWRAEFRDTQLNDIRVFRVNGFERILVIYRPTDDGGIDVLRLVHGSRNLQRLLRMEGLE